MSEENAFECKICGAVILLSDYDNPHHFKVLKDEGLCEVCKRKGYSFHEPNILVKTKRKLNFDYLFVSLAYHIDKATEKKPIHTNFGDFLAKHHTILQFFEFCFVGALGMIPNWIVFNVLLNVGLLLPFSWFIGFIVGALSNFVLSKYGVFQK